MKVKRNTLLLLDCLVWSAAGVNILRVGLMAYPAYRTVWNFVLSGLVFAVFQIFVFGKLVKKHTARIAAYLEERHFFLKFFDKKYSGSPVADAVPAIGMLMIPKTCAYVWTVLIGYFAMKKEC